MAVIEKQKKIRYRVNGRFTTQPPSPLPPHLKQTLAYARWFLASTLLFTTFILIFWIWHQPMEEFLEVLSDQAVVSAYLQSFGAWGPLVLAIVQFLQVLIVIIPGHVFLIAAGYVYGFLPGFVMNLVYVVVASQFAFLLSRWAGRPLVERLVSAESLSRWYRLGEERGFVFFTITFLLPVFPTDLMNFVAGLTGISNGRFFAANVLGRLPGVVMLTLIGSHGLELSTMSWVIMGLIVASFYVIGRFTIPKLEKRPK